MPPALTTRGCGYIRRKFLNTCEGMEEFVAELEKGDSVVIEAAMYWQHIYDALERAEVEVMLANPRKTRAIAEARLKNDKVDASTLADLLRADLVAPCYIPPRRIRELRGLIKHRMTLVKDMTQIKNRVHALPDKYELEGFRSSDMFGRDWHGVGL